MLSTKTDRPAHLRSLARVFVVRTKKPCILYYRCPHEEALCSWLSKMRPAKILIRLRECAGRFESALGKHIQRYVFWSSGSCYSRQWKPWLGADLGQLDIRICPRDTRWWWLDVLCPFNIIYLYHFFFFLIVLGFNDTSTLEGHFVSSPREREKRDRRESRGEKRE